MRNYWLLSFVLNNATHPYIHLEIIAILEVHFLTSSFVHWPDVWIWGM